MRVHPTSYRKTSTYNISHIMSVTVSPSFLATLPAHKDLVKFDKAVWKFKSRLGRPAFNPILDFLTDMAAYSHRYLKRAHELLALLEGACKEHGYKKRIPDGLLPDIGACDPEILPQAMAEQLRAFLGAVCANHWVGTLGDEDGADFNMSDALKHTAREFKRKIIFALDRGSVGELLEIESRIESLARWI